MVFYFQYEKARLERKRVVEMSKGYGKPKVGGPFTLKDLDGMEFTEKDLLGKYTLVHLIHIIPRRLVSGQSADP
jgi:protein SCO1